MSREPPFAITEALALRRYHSQEAERKADPNGPKHNTVPGKLPIGLFTGQAGQGVSKV